MIKPFKALLCAVLWLPASLALALPLTPEEQAWIAEHPVVHYSLQPNWPLEYVERGQHVGLSRAYLDRIAASTGLVFSYEPSDQLDQALRLLRSGKLDMAVALSARLVGDRVLQQVMLSDPYFVGSTVIVARADAPLMFSPQKLRGQVVAIRRSGGYASYLRAVCPDITLLEFDDAEQALEAVASGRAFATVGLDLILQPVMRRDYGRELRVAGVLADMPVVLSMGIAPADSPLQGIIDKALASLSVNDRAEIESSWVDNSVSYRPTLLAIVKDRWVEATALALVLLALLLLARRARQAQRSAQASENAKSAFLAMMSHEIRTPMNAVQASIELLLRSPLNGQQASLVNLANDSSLALLEMLDDVLDIARLDAHAVTLAEQPTDLPRLAESVADIYRLRAQGKGLALNLVLEGFDSAAHWRVDAMRLRQVLSNLLSNAVKFTERGWVELRLQLQHREGGQAWLSAAVRDTGIGIDPQQQQRLFQAFTQASTSTTRQYGGSGLGLSICKQLAALMGGQIEVQSEAGAGSLFRLLIPLKPAAPLASEPTTAPAAPAAPAQRCKVLVVEDHPVNRQVLGLQLDSLGYPWSMAADGHQALAMFEQGGCFGAVLLDCYLPEIDGYEIAQRLRQREQANGLPRLPIIAISAATDERHRERAWAAGMDAISRQALADRGPGQGVGRACPHCGRPARRVAGLVRGVRQQRLAGAAPGAGSR
ncbi:ATP-binding protein [Pseudomonas sp. KNUC1026]|uniref:ATP-binding protein n=1 Tax=Pseudomonas sp. KNUC1026 TaxID=2893890 RepID=UPI001F42C767|nr:ATP-binding protein [Pseudomonas sp. KNUC1026]UFH51094.1 transporter substrate-binding domain-containing protein [Pseudomonas sp. KNUC1026]